MQGNPQNTDDLSSGSKRLTFLTFSFSTRGERKFLQC